MSASGIRSMRGLLRCLAWAGRIVSLLLGIVGGAAYWLYLDVTDPGPLAEARTVVIPAHTGLAEIAAVLVEQGVIRHARSFELGATLSGRGSALLAGEYEFPAGASPLHAVGILASGQAVKNRST